LIIILSTKAERFVVLVVILKYLFEAYFSNRDDLNTDLILCLQKYYQSILFRNNFIQFCV